METFFPWLSENLEPPEIEVWVEPTVNSYEEMINSILIWVPSPILQTNEQPD